MSNTEKIEYTKNETPEQAAIRRESDIGVVDTSKPDGTKVEGANSNREVVKKETSRCTTRFIYKRRRTNNILSYIR